MTLTYFENFLNLVFAVTVCISISDFASLINISKGVMSSVIELNICGIIARIKKYKSITKKKKKMNDKIALLAKTNSECTKGSYIDSYIECDYFLLMDVLREYDGMKEKINKLETS